MSYSYSVTTPETIEHSNTATPHPTLSDLTRVSQTFGCFDWYERGYPTESYISEPEEPSVLRDELSLLYCLGHCLPLRQHFAPIKHWQTGACQEIGVHRVNIEICDRPTSLVV